MPGTPTQDDLDLVNQLVTAYWTSTSQSPRDWGSLTAPLTYAIDPKAGFTASDVTGITDALRLWSDVANIGFVPTTNYAKADIQYTTGLTKGADTNLEFYNTKIAGNTFGSVLAVQMGITIDITQPSWTDLGSLGAQDMSGYLGYGLETIIHETGHALGLGHAGVYNAKPGGGPQDYYQPGQLAHDSRQYSLMSYIDVDQIPADAANFTPAGYKTGDEADSTPMLDDILAIQSIYGANTSTRAGDTVYGFHATAGEREYDFTQNAVPVLCIWDGGGSNTLDLSGYTLDSSVDLFAGGFSSVAGLVDNLSIAYGTTIDTAIGGGGNDAFFLNDDSDTIDGGGGINSVFLPEASSFYRYSLSGTTTLLSATDGSGIVERLSNIEQVFFTDGSVPTTSLGQDDWTGAGGDPDFKDAANWSLGNVPGPSYTATIGATYHVELGGTYATEIGAVNLAAGALLDLADISVTLDNIGSGSTITGTLQISDEGGDATLLTSGTIENNGVINISGPGAVLQTNGNMLTLTGTGSVQLENATIGGRVATGGRFVYDTFANFGNIIAGNGVIGRNGFVDEVRFINAGVVNADGYGALVLEDSVVNQSILEATGSGTLDLGSGSFLDNSTGTIIVGAATARVTLDAITVQGGHLTAVKGAVLEMTAGTTLDGSLTPITLSGDVSVDDAATLTLIGHIAASGATLATAGSGQIRIVGDTTLDGTLGAILVADDALVVVATGGTLTLAGTIDNPGVLRVSSDITDASFEKLRLAGPLTLIGGGQVVLENSTGRGGSASLIGTGTLDNVDNTLSGSGVLGAGDNGLTLINEPGGTLDPAGGVLVVNTGTHVVRNRGLLTASAGELDLHGVVANTGGTIATTDGATQLVSVTVTGGIITSSGGGSMRTAGNTTLDGRADPMILSAQIIVDNSTLTLAGTIENHGYLGIEGNLEGNDYASVIATAEIAGAVILTGGGNLALYSVSGPPIAAAQLITGADPTAALDNIDNKISGYGSIDAGHFALTNETAGIIAAIGGTLTVNTGSQVVINHGLLQASDGTLVIQGVVDDRAGGVVATQNIGGSGIVQLDGGTLRGGTLRTDAADAASQVQVAGAGGTLDGTVGTLTLAPGAQIAIVPGSTLTATGAIANHGTLQIDGAGYSGIAGELLVAGTLGLSGGGLVALLATDGFITPGGQVITGDTLDNVDNRITGYGELGAGHLTLTNEAKGTIAATTGILTLNTGANAVVNHGLVQANAGTLLLQSVIDDTAGGTIDARNAGTVLLDGVTVRGGTIVTDASASFALTAAGGTLDGSTGPLSLAAGSNAIVTTGQTLAVRGAIIEAGTLSVLGNGGIINAAELAITGTVSLTGAGIMVMADASNYYGASISQVITGATPDAELDNAAQISGYGELGAAALALINEAPGTITATGGLLTIDAGASTATNRGQIHARTGTLQLEHTMSNAGTIAADAVGSVILDGLVRNTGTIAANPGGSMTLFGTITGATGSVDAGAGASLIFTGGSLLGGGLTGVAGSAIHVTPGTTTLASVAVSNAGTTSLDGNGGIATAAELAISGTVSLTGAGTVMMADVSNYYGSSTSQVITGDVLDNVDNKITGYGELGASHLTLINEAKGTIAATAGILTLNTGAVALTNHGLVQANAGILQVQSVIDDTAGGMIDARNAGTVLLDGATLRGGNIVTDAGATLSLTAAGGTLDGSTIKLTLAAGSNALVAAGQTLSLRGAITEAGTMSVLGNGGNINAAELAISGTVALTGAGIVVMVDASNYYDSSISQVITGAAPGAELDNAAQISGFGELGAAALALINEAPGTITATGGALVIDAGANTALNRGQVHARAGTLQIEHTLTNTGTISADAAGSFIVDGLVENTGTIAATSGGTMTVFGTIAGATGTVNVKSGATLIFTGGSLLGGRLAGGTGSAIDITPGAATLSAVAFSNAGTTDLEGNGGNPTAAKLVISSTVSLTGAGTVMMADISNYYNASASQVITGAAPGDALDNIDNLIIGYGELGAGQLTLINEAKGTIEASNAILMLNTGGAALVNHGLVQADGGILQLQSVIDDTAGGTIDARDAGTVLLDGATIRGGTIVTDAGAMLSLTPAGGTLDGSLVPLTLTDGSNAIVAAGQSLALRGNINEAGTLSVLGNGGNPNAAELAISGTVALTGAGTVVMADASSYYFSSASQVITGAAPGAELDNHISIIGYGSLGAGQLAIVNEAGGTIAAKGGALIIDPAGGTLTNAGLLRATGGASLSAPSLSVGGIGSNVDIEGAGSNLSLTGDLDIGLVAPGLFYFGPDTSVSVAGTIDIGANGTFDALGTLDPATLINDGIGTLGGFDLVEGTIENAGWFTISADQVTIDAKAISFDPAHIGAGGTWAIGRAGTLILNTTTIDSSQTIAFSGTDAVLVIGQSPDIDAGGGATGTISPDAPSLLLNHRFQAVLQNFAAGDEIRLPGLAVGSATSTGGAITLWSGPAGTGTIEGSLNFITATGATDVTGASSAAAAVNESMVACFTAGTLIETISGSRPVEQLQIGDQLITFFGAARAVRWIGRRSYSAQFAARNPAVWPVRIRAGALADRVPARDLLVSPLHAMYLDLHLVPAHLLINGASILQNEPTHPVDYFHVELETHDVIFAEGAPTESYIDFDNRHMFQNAAEYACLYPQRAPDPSGDCARRLEGGVAVDALCKRLAARADVHTQGRTHTITLADHGGTRASVPAGVTELRLRSASAYTSGDRRILGALLTGVRLDGISLDLAATCFRRGFHPPEQHHDRRVRWTNGSGVIALSPGSVERIIEIDVAAVMAEARAA